MVKQVQGGEGNKKRVEVVQCTLVIHPLECQYVRVKVEESEDGSLRMWILGLGLGGGGVSRYCEDYLLSLGISVEVVK